MGETNRHVDDILALIDGILPPEDAAPMQEISGLLIPQFAAIVDLSGIERVTDNHHFDTHHLFYPRCDYKTRTERLFRRAFAIPINRGVHNEIHATIKPPRKPSRAVMLGYLSLLDKKDGE